MNLQRREMEQDTVSFQMAVYMKGNGRMTWPVVKEGCYMTMETITQVNGIKVLEMVKEPNAIAQETSTQVPGRTISNTEQAD